MLEVLIKLLERFVIAHELIAANSAKTPAQLVNTEAESGETLKEDAAEKPKTTRKASAKKEEQTKDEPKKKPADVDLRTQIKELAQQIASGDDDDCADDFDSLLDDYDVRSVTKLDDEDLESFHKAALKLVKKYYDVED